MNPVRASLLISGLQSMPDSLYRARLLSERSKDGSLMGDGDDGPVVLPWLGWDSTTMLLTDIRNLIDAVVAARAGKKVKPHPVHAPSYVDARDLPHGRVDARQFEQVAKLMGLA